jgi:6-phosphofructo-2-kinase
MSNRVLATSASELKNISNISEQDFQIPRFTHDTLLVPQATTSAGRALQDVNMNGHGPLQDGVGHPLSDTPLGSAPSTAPGSPRL